MARRISERVLHHSEREINSHILKHQMEKEHPCPQYKNFKVISSGFPNNTKKRRLSEALWINTLSSSLSKGSLSLKLFNYCFFFRFIAYLLNRSSHFHISNLLC